MSYETDRQDYLLPDSAYGKCDKVTLLLDMEPDRFQQVAEGLRQTYQSLATPEVPEVPYSVRVLGANPANGTRLYEIDTYGPGADAVLQHLPAHYWSRISRLDYRIATPVSTEYFGEMYNYIKQHQKGNRNVNLFDTRERKKTEGRHAGGVGIAIGSHKSDMRLVIYKRKSEDGAIELQITGDVLGTLVTDARHMITQDVVPTFYNACMILAHAKMVYLAKKIGFAGVDHLVKAVSPGQEEDDSHASLLGSISRVADFMKAASRKERAVIAAQLGLGLPE